MAICPKCGQENPPIAKFCLACAEPLADQAHGLLDERKIVTVIFADLVGFTARAELLDPEDVREILQAYHTRVKAEIERFGGVVEKFIGDAVMGVFGAPAAHGDDPERAVRSAMAVLEAVEELNRSDPELDLQVRLAVNTGEAIVSLGARAEQARRWSQATSSTRRPACRRPLRRMGSSWARRPSCDAFALSTKRPKRSR